jgi:sugar/nucleoside kinase (ribokinase family)
MRFPFKLAENKDFDAVGFGTNAVDYLIQVPEYPVFNSKIELTEYVQAAGGEVATTMAGLRRLGLKTSYIGRFGSDAEGDLGWKTLADEGVDLAYAERIAGARTQIAFIIIDTRNGERTVIWQRDAKLAYTEDEAPIDAVGRCRILHFTPHDARACLRLARTAKAAGAVVSIDIDNLFDGVDDLLHEVDILVTSADFPGRLLGISDERDALREMTARYGCAVAGITLGAEGSLLYSGGSYIETPGFAVPGGCRDTTGAGDSYRVGLLYGLLKGESIEESARMANGVAALKCRAIGARTSLPDSTVLDSLLAGLSPEFGATE